MDYPLYKNYVDFDKDKFFAMVSMYVPRILRYLPQGIKYKKSVGKYNGKYFLIQEGWDEVKNINTITDLFSEEARIKANFKGFISPIEYWMRNKEEILKEFGGKITKNNIEEFRDYMYAHIKFCNNYRITTAYTIYKHFNAKHVLDPSSGWGDRMIGAISANVETYTGVDPNGLLQECYDEIINKFGMNKTNYKVHKNGFEYVDVGENKYDLVFTSPPFFDLEKYSDDEEDSMNAYNTEERWLESFLKPLIYKSYKGLINNGHLVLYIAESKNTKYIPKMMEYTKKYMTYEGEINVFSSNTNVTRKIYVWRK